MTVVAIDPGDRHVGLARFADDGAIEGSESFTQDEAKELVDVLDMELLIIESFRLDPERAAQQSRSDMSTPQLIGALRAIADRRGVPVRMQEPVCKSVAFRSPWRFMLTDEKIARNRHARDAAAHGVFYFGFERRVYGKPPGR